MKMTFSGEVTHTPGSGFGVRIELGSIPTEAQANEIASALDSAIRGYFAGKGAELVREIGSAPVAAPKIILNG